MRLGANVRQFTDPEDWIAALREKGYRAAYCPVRPDADDALIAEYRQAAQENDIVIAETGAWNNMLSPDADARRRNIDHNIEMLALADKIGARCCVNVSGNPTDDAEWDRYFLGYDSDETYGMVAEAVRYVIDSVKPRTARFSLECMQWMIPDSTESYERLIKMVDRPEFAVHLDAVNMINSPWRYAHNGEYTAEFIARLGRSIASVHVKDVILRRERMLVHLEETLCGTGTFDHAAMLKALNAVDPDIPLMLEHLPSLSDYDAAAAHVRAVAAKCGLEL